MFVVTTLFECWCLPLGVLAVCLALFVFVIAGLLRCFLL